MWPSTERQASSTSSPNSGSHSSAVASSENHPIRWFSLLALPLFLAAPPLLALGFLRFRGGELIGTGFDTFWLTAGVVASLVAINVFLLGFLAELQLRASNFFKRRVWTTARGAVQ